MQDKMFLPIYFNILVYCQAQPKPKLSWAELALMLINPATRPTACPETAENEENKENLPSNIFSSTLVELKRNLKIWKAISIKDSWS